MRWAFGPARRRIARRPSPADVASPTIVSFQSSIDFQPDRSAKTIFCENRIDVACGVVWSQRQATVKQPFRRAALGSLTTLKTVVPVELGARAYEVVVGDDGWKSFADR